jgi:hypothetical protein
MAVMGDRGTVMIGHYTVGGRAS